MNQVDVKTCITQHPGYEALTENVHVLEVWYIGYKHEKEEDRRRMREADDYYDDEDEEEEEEEEDKEPLYKYVI